MITLIIAVVGVLVGAVLGYKGHGYFAAKQAQVKAEVAAVKQAGAAIKKVV